MSASVKRFLQFSHAKMSHNSKYYTKRLTKKDAKGIVCVSDLFKAATPKSLLGDREAWLADTDPSISLAADSVSPVIADDKTLFPSVSPVIAGDTKNVHASEITTSKSESLMDTDVDHDDVPPPTKILKQYKSPAPDQRQIKSMPICTPGYITL
jgi:hypothetical protein